MNLVETIQIIVHTPITGITYDGNPHVLVNAGSCGGGTMKYSRTGSVWTDELPTETEPGTYYIIYNCVPDSNHSGSCSDSFTVEISNPSGTYLTFIATDACTFKTTKATQYSINNGTWTSLAANTNVSVSSGSSIRWKGAITPAMNVGVGSFSASTGHFKAMGNPASLISGDSFTSLTTVPSYGFEYLFRGCTGLTDAENISLQYTQANQVAFLGMFSGCTSLTVGPKFYNIGTSNGTNICREMFVGCSAMTRAMDTINTIGGSFHCYCMFSGCTSLTTAPSLPAHLEDISSVTQECYFQMFKNCTSLTTAPDLPTLTFSTKTAKCYREMFYGCTSLNYIKAMFTTTPQISSQDNNYWTYNWVVGVASSGTFVKNSAATWNVTGNYGVPTGWNVQTSSN